MVKLKKNEIYDVTITGYSSEGLGVCRIDGIVVFVKGAIAGEQLRVKLVKVLKNMCYAIIVEIVIPSTERKEPDCPYYRLCGGCAFRHMSYAEECRLKEERVNDALKRLAGLDIKAAAFTPSDETVGYRNKAQMFFSGKGKLKAGFYRAGSHDVIDCNDCMLQDERSMQCLRAVRKFAKRFGIAAVDAGGCLRFMQVRTGTGGALMTLVLSSDTLGHEDELVQIAKEECSELCGIVLSINEDPKSVTVGKACRVIYGKENVTDQLCGLSFEISPRSFYQINRNQAEKLYITGKNMLNLNGTEKLLDLYCGIGTIGMSMAGSVKNVLGIEIVDSAIENAKNNASKNGIQNAVFKCFDVGELAVNTSGNSESPNVIIVDPPRKGLGEKALDYILEMGSEKVLYISCDPATLGRDLKKICETGKYAVARVEAFDLFPRCAHVETVVLLCKK